MERMVLSKRVPGLVVDEESDLIDLHRGIKAGS
jgi:hypothetical protein